MNRLTIIRAAALALALVLAAALPTAASAVTPAGVPPEQLVGCTPELLDRLTGLPVPPIDPTGTVQPTQEQRDVLAGLPPIPLADLPPGLNVLTCNIVGHTVSYGVTSATVPLLAGASITISELETGWESVEVETLGSGEIVARHEEDEEAEEDADLGTLGSSDGCSQRSWSVAAFRVRSEFAYYQNINGRGSGLTEDEARTGLKSGFDIILTNANDCNRPDFMTLTARRLGDTGYLPGYGDGRNVIGFRDLENNVKGRAYLTVANGALTEGDIAINGTDYRWVNTITSTCGVSRHLASTMAHEVGHLYGLRHSDDYDNALTMYSKSSPCRTHKATLGYGDMVGLDWAY